ncbi:RNA-binding protein pop5 [Linderina macrospora]|uniref:RNA-binding protein pop5 n=1 Tax=Linderina macrospora TaxID=4868 RepID=A0ACC1JHF7_9FUNG|nr:RNA-binding protein pop5 [Linderina macrospora]
MVRFKHRYLCFEIQFHPAAEQTPGHQRTGQKQPVLTSKAVLHMIKDQMQVNFGDSGAGHIVSGTQVKYFSSRTNMCILKVPRDHYQMIWSALTLTTHISRAPCMIRMWHVSGTIKKCQQAAIKVDRRLILEWHRQQQTMAKQGGGAALVSSTDNVLTGALKESEKDISALDM